jgi:hypothetical protein
MLSAPIIAESLVVDGSDLDDSVAFAANGIVHFWKHHTTWYLEWQKLAEEDSQDDDDLDDDDRLSEEQRTRLTAELVEALLANPEFWVAKAGARQRIANLAIPPDTPRGLEWEVVRIACDRADELARVAYASSPTTGLMNWPQSCWPPPSISGPARCERVSR